MLGDLPFKLLPIDPLLKHIDLILIVVLNSLHHGLFLSLFLLLGLFIHLLLIKQLILLKI